jgi:putative hemin transport protein
MSATLESKSHAHGSHAHGATGGKCPFNHGAGGSSAGATSPEAAMMAELKGKVQARLAEDPKLMTMVLARELGVPEMAVIRCLPEKQVVELDGSQWEAVIRSFTDLGNVHVIASNGACTLECFGVFGNFSTWNDYFNVQTKTLDMHIRHTELSAIFAVEKPSHMDGVNTLSFQFYDKRGVAAFKVFLTFGGDAPSAEKLAGYTKIRDGFRLAK